MVLVPMSMAHNVSLFVSGRPIVRPGVAAQRAYGAKGECPSWMDAGEKTESGAARKPPRTSG